ncbi:Uncharacterised protein [Mycobacteroides abscessus]|nr:Uncharacterised protein [Mycobacteroides abscessus]
MPSITRYAAWRTWSVISSSSPCVKWWPSGETQSRIGTGPMRACDHSANPVSPCSPTMSACTLVAATRALSATRRRSREVSSTVPDEKTRDVGRPLICCAATVSTSHGLVTMQ